MWHMSVSTYANTHMDEACRVSSWVQVSSSVALHFLVWDRVSSLNLELTDWPASLCDPFVSGLDVLCQAQLLKWVWGIQTKILILIAVFPLNHLLSPTLSKMMICVCVYRYTWETCAPLCTLCMWSRTRCRSWFCPSCRSRDQTHVTILMARDLTF